MFCNHCGKENPPWKPYKHWSDPCELCPECWQYKWDHHVPSRAGKDHFCIQCGAILPMITRTRNGKEYQTSGMRKRCTTCFPPPTWIKKEKKCVVCGKELPRRGRVKYCCEHRPKPKKYPALHRKYSLQWQKENQEKVRAATRARYHAHKTVILYECACEGVEKENHHPDYALEFIVVRLCDRCHKAEHRRLRRLAARSALNTPPEPVEETPVNVTPTTAQMPHRAEIAGGVDAGTGAR